MARRAENATNELKAGHQIFCANGHHICDVVKDIEFGQMNWASHFGNWQQPEPQVGDPYPGCAVCGALIDFTK